MVSGNKDHEQCRKSYKDMENCVFSDACDMALNQYAGYKCMWISRLK